MNARQLITVVTVIILMSIMLIGCFVLSTTNTDYSPTAGKITPTPGKVTPMPDRAESPNPANANAQATIDYGKSQLLELSRKSTEVSQNMTQAARAAALTTLDYSRRQKLELDSQATAISLNITQAAATQGYLAQQTKNARDALATAQSGAATATRAAYLLNLTQTAQAQGILKEHASQTAQAVAALTAYPLTATPYAVTQAALLMQQYGRERQSFLEQVVAPLLPIIAILDLVLFILIIIVAYRQYISLHRNRPLLNILTDVTPRRLMIIDSVAVDQNSRFHRIIPPERMGSSLPELPNEMTVQDE